LAAFDSAFGHGHLAAKTEEAGSLWRRAQGKLCLSDKYLQKIGESIDRGHRLRRRGAEAVGQVLFRSRNFTNPGVGAAAGCDLLIWFFCTQDQKIAAFGSSYIG
jgi:hypothetical protein